MVLNDLNSESVTSQSKPDYTQSEEFPLPVFICNTKKLKVCRGEHSGLYNHFLHG